MVVQWLSPKWYYKATQDTHTHTNAHTDTILKTFLWALASCFTGFVRAFPNSIDLWRCLITGEEKNCKKKRKEPQREGAWNYGSDSADLLYVHMYVHIRTYVLSYLWQWTVRGLGQMQSQNKIKTSNVKQPFGVLPPPAWYFFSHVNLDETSVCFPFYYNRIVIIIIVIFSLGSEYFINC